MKSFSDLADWNQRQRQDLERRIRDCVTTYNAMVAIVDGSENGEVHEEVERWMKTLVDNPPVPPSLSGRVTVDAYVRNQEQKFDSAIASLDAELRAKLQHYVMRCQGRHIN
jgi:hypothetical protein